MKKQHAIQQNLNQKAPAPVVPGEAATAGQEHGREAATASRVSRAGDERTGTGEAGSATFSQRQQDEQRADKRAAAIARLNIPMAMLSPRQHEMMCSILDDLL